MQQPLSSAFTRAAIVQSVLERYGSVETFVLSHCEAYFSERKRRRGKKIKKQWTRYGTEYIAEIGVSVSKVYYYLTDDDPESEEMPGLNQKLGGLLEKYNLPLLTGLQLEAEIAQRYGTTHKMLTAYPDMTMWWLYNLLKQEGPIYFEPDIRDLYTRMGLWSPV